jgi:hypothetical protein
LPKNGQGQVHADISLDNTRSQIVELAGTVSHGHSKVGMFHLDKTQTRNWLPTGTSLSPDKPEVTVPDFGNLPDGLAAKHRVFSLRQFLLVVLTSRTVDIGRLCLLELRLIVAEVLLDE